MSRKSRSKSPTPHYINFTSDFLQQHIRNMMQSEETFPKNKHCIYMEKLQESWLGIFYLLAKIHNSSNPGHPIVSSIRKITTGMSGFMDHTISTPSCIRDATDFLRRLDIVDGQHHFSHHVCWYTNISNKYGLQAIRDIITVPKSMPKTGLLCTHP